MQYLQIKPQLPDDVPLPIAGNMNYFIDSSDNIAKLKDSDGNLHFISGINIPKPFILSKYNENTGPSLQVFFQENTFNFSNAKLFLFRWRKAKKIKRKTGVVSSIKVKKSARWVHPTDKDAATNYPNSKWFNGTQSGLYDTPITGRTTEFEIPNDVTRYQAFDIDFNVNMFWSKINTGDNTFEYDSDFTSDKYLYEIVSATNIGVSGNHKARMQKFCLAVAIPNPFYTLNNGLCPMIFGPMSDAFYVRFLINRNIDDEIKVLDKYIDLQPMKYSNNIMLHA